VSGFDGLMLAGQPFTADHLSAVDVYKFKHDK
jgi:hypothetical protein